MGSLHIFLLCVWLAGPTTAQDKRMETCGSPFRDNMSPAEVARELGIVKGKVASVPSGFGFCCPQNESCVSKGGKCVPNWFEEYFPCNLHHLCPSESCICALPDHECDCSGGCEGGKGNCRKNCLPDEVQSSSSWCKNRNCKCCVRCSGTCSGGGSCRKSCSRLEKDAGPCSESGCRCCQQKQFSERNCGDSCGKMKFCSSRCYSTITIGGEEISRQTLITGPACPATCPCCPVKGLRSMEVVEDVQPDA